MYFYLFIFNGLVNYNNPLGPVWSHDKKHPVY